jgi:hypothetical protein
MGKDPDRERDPDPDLANLDKRWIQIFMGKDPDRERDPDPDLTNLDKRWIQIRIRTKTVRIRNTSYDTGIALYNQRKTFVYCCCSPRGIDFLKIIKKSKIIWRPRWFSKLQGGVMYTRVGAFCH